MFSEIDEQAGIGANIIYGNMKIGKFLNSRSKSPHFGEHWYEFTVKPGRKPKGILEYDRKHINSDGNKFGAVCLHTQLSESDRRKFKLKYIGDKSTIKLVNMWNSDYTIDEIANKFGLSKNYLRVRVSNLLEAGWDLRDRRNKSYLNPIISYAIYQGDEYIDSGTAEEVAEKLGVSPRLVYYWSTPSVHERYTGNCGGYIAYAERANDNYDDEDDDIDWTMPDLELLNKMEAA